MGPEQNLIGKPWLILTKPPTYAKQLFSHALLRNSQELQSIKNPHFSVRVIFKVRI